MKGFRFCLLNRLIYFAVICLGVTACTVGPNFHKPLPPPTQRYTYKPLASKTLNTPQDTNSGKAQYFVNNDLPGEWWKLFHSQQLNHLIELGLKHNPTLAAAKARLQAAEYNLRADMGNLLFPAIDLAAFARRNKVASILYGVPDSPSIFNIYNTTFNASYFLDFFGKNKREIEALQASVNYERYQFIATYLTLTTNIITTGISIASLDAQIRITNQLIQAQQQILNILKQQLSMGGASDEDLLMQQIQLDQTKATLPPLQKGLEEEQHALAALIGQLTSQTPATYLNLNAINLPAKLPISLPSSLISQRPDIQAATAMLQAASAQIGVATANMLPQVTIEAGYGWLSTFITNLWNNRNAVWNFGAALLQPVFHGGALIASRRAAIKTYKEMLEEYKETLLNAFKNVADALLAIKIDANAFNARYQAESSAKATFSLINKRFLMGGQDYLAVLNAEKQYLDTRLQRIKAQATRYSDTAALFQALGGGWWHKKWVKKQIKPLYTWGFKR